MRLPQRGRHCEDGGAERVFGGTYWHHLTESDGGFRIRWKKALLANCDARLSPFFVYF